MLILSLDISTSAGYAVLDNGRLSGAGCIANKQTIAGYGSYPTNYYLSALSIAKALAAKAQIYNPDVIVIEETNGSRSRYTQKILEFLHCLTIQELISAGFGERVVYVNSSDWRRITGVTLTKEDKDQNKLLSKAKSKAKKAQKKLDKKELGISGKITLKHVAIRVANKVHNLNLRPKDDDIADAICIATAYHLGVKICDGTK